MKEINIIKDLDDLMSSTVRIYWSGTPKEDNKINVRLFVTDNLEKTIKKIGTKTCKYWKFNNLNDCLDNVKSIYKHFNQEPPEDSKLRKVDINKDSEIYLFAFLK